MKRLCLILFVLLCLTPVSVRYWIQETYGAECGDACSDPVRYIDAEPNLVMSGDEIERFNIARANPAVLGASSGAAGPVYTDCSQIGTAQFYWSGEHASGNTYGCKNSTTTINGTATGAEIVDSDSDPGVASPASGNNVVKVNAADERLVFSVTSKDIFDSAEGRWCGDVYLAASTGSNTLFRGVVGANDVVVITALAANTVQINHTGQTAQVTVTSSVTIPDTTWTTICGYWSVSNNKVGIKVCSGTDCSGAYRTACASGCDVTDPDTITVFASEPTTIRAMGGSTQADNAYIDNVFIWTTSGL